MPKMPVTWSGIMHIFNEIWCSYSILSKILTQMTYMPNITKIHWKQLKLSSGHQTLKTEQCPHSGSLRKAQKIGKNTNVEIKQNPGLISCVPIRSLYISSLKALAGKFTSEMPKMPKSHDQPLCAYLMRYDAHLQSHPRSWPKWYIYQNKLKFNENNSIHRPDTKHSWPSTKLH